MSDQPAEHDAVATDVITAELVACTLGQRQRPELRVDRTRLLPEAIAAGIARAVERMNATMARWSQHTA